MPLSLALLMTMTAANAAPEYRPVFEPGVLKADVAGARNEVLVLGTPHLSGWPDDFAPAHLEPLLDRLAAWNPRIITIEALSGTECDMLQRYPGRYADTYKHYCWNPAPALKATGLDVAAATAEADTLLARWPATPSPAQRRRLAALFLAGGDSASALVQWLRLPAGERRAGEGLDDMLIARLTMLATRRNENFLIGAALAARLGLERVHSVDDHSADMVTASVNDDPGYGAALRRAWDNPLARQRRATDKALEAKLGSGEGVLALYRAYNQPGEARLAYESDFGAALKDASPKQYGRRYAGWWETRNLRMVANIRAAMAAEPGVRTLAIVGASHKGYYEAYLNMMHDVRMIDAEALLK